MSLSLTPHASPSVQIIHELSGENEELKDELEQVHAAHAEGAEANRCCQCHACQALPCPAVHHNLPSSRFAI